MDPKPDTSRARHIRSYLFLLVLYGVMALLYWLRSVVVNYPAVELAWVSVCNESK
jgi:hypothetical protein